MGRGPSYVLANRRTGEPANRRTGEPANWPTHHMDQQLLLGTNNRHKVAEISAMLSALRVRVLTPRDLGISEDPLEDGATFQANALVKARFFSEQAGLPCLADDSGLVVDALAGRPGVLSSRYAPTDQERIARLLEELRDVPERRRTARFVCAAALVIPAVSCPSVQENPARGRSINPPAEPNAAATTEILETGICDGAIGFEPRGSGGFGYDPVFLIPGLRKTMAELTPEEKNTISHRGRALAAMKPHLLRFLA